MRRPRLVCAPAATFQVPRWICNQIVNAVLPDPWLPPSARLASNGIPISNRAETAMICAIEIFSGVYRR